MFTGIIEDLGKIKAIEKRQTSVQLSVKSKLCVKGSKIGDSISINGTCLTVTGINADTFLFDVSTETLEKTNIGDLKSEDAVNIEMALKADSRLGGHFVTGHIDCVGRIVSKKQQGEFVKIEIELPYEFTQYIAEKGSIAIDGISLTINKVSDNRFSIMLIPHTILATTLGYKKEGSSVNIETDILAKYIYNRSLESPSSKINRNFLTEHGFI